MLPPPREVLDLALPEDYPVDGDVYVKSGGYAAGMMHTVTVPDARLPFVVVTRSQATALLAAIHGIGVGQPL